MMETEREPARSHGSHGLAELIELASLYRADIWTVVLYAACVGLFALTTPIAVQALVNTTAFGTALQPVMVLGLLLLLGLVFSGVLKALKSWAVEVLQRRLFVQTVAKLAYRLPRAVPGHDAEHGTAHLEHRFFDLFTVQKAASSLLLSGIDVVLAASVGMVVLAFYHPILLAFDLVLVACLAFIVFVLGRGGLRSSLAESARKYEMASFLGELVRSGVAFRDRGGMRYAHERLDSLAQGYLISRAAHFRVVMRQFAGALTLHALASAGLLGLGGFLVIERELTLGQLVAAELMVTTVVSTLSALGKHVETYYDLVTGLHKLQPLVSVAIERSDQERESDELPTGPAELIIRDLHVAAAGQPVFANAQLALRPGTRAGLVEASHDAKRALLELLFGLRSVERGRITLDGVDLRELSRAALRERVAVLAAPELVAGTILDNVRLARREITPGRVRMLLEQLGMGEELAHLPRGLDTKLGAQGATLSPGQAFRLTAARALARSPGLIVIDADVSAVDAASLERVLEVICQPAAPWTVLVLSERPYVLRHSQETLRFSRGQLLAGENR